MIYRPMSGDLYVRTNAAVSSEGFSSRQPNAGNIAVAAVRVSCVIISATRDGLIHRESFVGNYVKATLLYLGESTAAR